MSKQPPDKPSESDAELFRRSVGQVRRLSDDKAPPHRVSHNAKPRPAIPEDVVIPPPDRDRRWLGATRGEALEFHRPGVQPRTLKRLRRGQYPIAATLDLHGSRARDAERALHRFLNECVHHHWRCVRIIHGKGISSSGGQPVLKGLIATWLSERADINAFCSAPAADGGTGAMYVLLAARRK